MGDIYENAVEAEVDRAQQQALLVALNAAEQSLRREECGPWRISGRDDGAGGSIHGLGQWQASTLHAVSIAA
jgi:hypothetical protein